MTCNYSLMKLEERLVKLERSNRRLSLAVTVFCSAFCLILLSGAASRVYRADEVECKSLKANRILLIDETLGVRHELDGNGWRIHNKLFSTSGSYSGIISSRATGEESYVSSEYGIHGFRMSAWDGKKRTYIARLGDTYPSGNGLGALEVFNRDGRPYFSALNGKVTTRELAPSEVQENAARHKSAADEQSRRIKNLFDELQSTSDAYRNDEYGFTVQFPDGWITGQGVASGTVAKAVHKNEAGKVAMVNINVQELAEGDGDALKKHSAEEVFQIVTQQFSGQGREITLLDSGVTSVGGEHAIWHKYRLQQSHLMDKVFLTYNIIHDNYLFVVSGSADHGMYPEMDSLLRESIMSIRFD
ncbi:MAG: hypothetical protein JXN61_17840 [Sedimentisphaerales bacterium]|nr:hypothetical protein [Sedimentisphaerales bacterium]